MALATQADLEYRAQIDFGADPDNVVTWLLDTASALVENAIGYKIEQANGVVERHDGGHFTVVLDRPILAVTSVDEDGTVLTVDDDYYVESGARGIIYRLSGDGKTRRRFYAGFRVITVTYDAGWATVPNDIRQVTTDIAFRMFQDGAAYAENENPGISHQEIGEYEITYLQSQTRNLKAYMSDEDHAVLASYRRSVFA